MKILNCPQKIQKFQQQKFETNRIKSNNPKKIYNKNNKKKYLLKNNCDT